MIFIKKLIKLIFFTTTIYSLSIAILYYSKELKIFENYNVKIIGNNFLSIDEIETKIYPYLQSSFFTINIKGFKKELLDIEYIDNVQISKILPKTLVINVIESKPALLIDDKQNMLKFMDINGNLLAANKRSINNFSVPIVSIYNKNHQNEILLNKLQFILKNLLIDNIDIYNNISELKINVNELSLHYKNGTIIYTHLSDFNNHLTILKEFKQTVYPKKNITDYSYIDLRVKNQVIVKEKYNKG